MTWCLVVGTRPELIKMAGVLHELVRRRRPFTFLHTGQHYDPEMSEFLFRDLDLPAPDRNLEIGSGTQAEQTGAAIVQLERAFTELRPDLVLVEGDTNSVLGAALAAVKIGIPVAHIEAGVRSYDLRMAEEHNRRLTDHLSSFLFAPSDRAADTLRRESCWGRVTVTGNTVIDACVRFGPKAEAISTARTDIPFDRFALATAHRAENVDDPTVLAELCRVFIESPIPVVYPVHPRARARLREAGLDARLEASGNVALLPPVGYLDFLGLFLRCAFVLTDSGGIQQEATAPNLRKKVFVLRDVTESPEAVEAGFVEVLGTRSEGILPRLRDFLQGTWAPSDVYPYGKGDASERIVDVLERDVPAGR